MRSHYVSVHGEFPSADSDVMLGLRRRWGKKGGVEGLFLLFFKFCDLELDSEESGWI